MNEALSKEIKNRKNGLEHEFELCGDFFWRKTKCVGAGISGGGHVGPRGKGVRPVPSWPNGGSPWCVLSARNS